MRPHRAAESSERVVERTNRLLPRRGVSCRNRFEVLAHQRGERGIPVNRYLAYLPDHFIGNAHGNVQCRFPSNESYHDRLSLIRLHPDKNAPPKRGAKNENYALLQFLKKTMFR